MTLEMRKFSCVVTVVGIALAGTVVGSGCKKSEDAPQANAPPSSTPVADESERETSATTPEPAQNQAPPPPAGLPSGGAQPATPADKKALDQPVEYQSVEEAEKALTGAKTELDKLLTKASGGADRLSTDDARCENACKAFSSMKRAGDAVCRLAGDSDPRCKKARTLVKGSESRVAVCKCDG
jgi:type IV secretory pathway VirB10-like protein